MYFASQVCRQNHARSLGLLLAVIGRSFVDRAGPGHNLSGSFQLPVSQPSQPVFLWPGCVIKYWMLVARMAVAHQAARLITSGARVDHFIFVCQTESLLFGSSYIAREFLRPCTSSEYVCAESTGRTPTAPHRSQASILALFHYPFVPSWWGVLEALDPHLDPC